MQLLRFLNAITYVLCRPGTHLWLSDTILIQNTHNIEVDDKKTWKMEVGYGIRQGDSPSCSISSWVI